MSAGRREQLRAQLRLMIITDRALAGDRGWLAVTEAALAAGATAVQLRDKLATTRELYEMAAALAPVSRRHGALFLVNDRFDVALSSGAHGVHLGHDDVPVEAVRRCAPRDFVIGRSADREAEAHAAAAAGADYLGVGSVYGTRSKPEVVGEAIGVEQLGRVAAAVSIPVIGIGGIDAGNAGDVVRAGAVGVAVVSEIMSAPDPSEAVLRITDSIISAQHTGRSVHRNLND